MLKRLLSFLISLIMAACALPGTNPGSDPGSVQIGQIFENVNGMRAISTMELVEEMGIGINLGNTMEACGDWIADVDRQWGDGVLETKDYETAWGSSREQKEKSYELCNRVNQKFVDVVRASGGNNILRHLLISGYNTAIDRTCDPLFKMPDDPVNRMAISVHYYTPPGFAILEDKDETWAKARSTWGTESDLKELESQMDMMKKAYTDKGIPVIIGEYGCPTKGKEPEAVRKYLSSVCEAAFSRGMCPILWATPQDKERPEDTLSGHYDRTACKLADPELKKAFLAITAQWRIKQGKQ